jgi:quercetin dioxygenase-like cupin family protein
MSTPFTYVEDLRAAAPPPENGTLSRTMHNDDTVKIIAFGFAAGQELSAHTSPMEVKLGSETMTAKPGTLIHMTPLLEHSLKATTPSTMVLYLLKNPR